LGNLYKWTILKFVISGYPKIILMSWKL
jgi:hypothetical protein